MFVAAKLYSNGEPHSTKTTLTRASTQHRSISKTSYESQTGRFDEQDWMSFETLQRSPMSHISGGLMQPHTMV
jgi:hypothetical protein